MYAETLQTFDNDTTEAVVNQHSHIEGLGLTWDADNRILIDPETGEVVRIFEVTDEATAKAAMYRLYATAGAAFALSRQIKALTGRKQAIMRRLEWLKDLWQEALIAYGKEHVGKGKSLDLTYGKIGYQVSTKPQYKANTGAEKLLFEEGDGTALTVTVNLDDLTDANRAKLLAVLREVDKDEEEDMPIFPPITVAINKKTIGAAHLLCAMEHESAAVSVIEAGTETWYARETKPKSEDEGDPE